MVLHFQKKDKEKGSSAGKRGRSPKGGGAKDKEGVSENIPQRGRGRKSKREENLFEKKDESPPAGGKKKRGRAQKGKNGFAKGNARVGEKGWSDEAR